VPGPIDQIVGQDRVGQAAQAVGVARRRVDLDGEEALAQERAQGGEALGGHQRIAGEAQAEHVEVAGGDSGAAGGIEAEVGAVARGHRQRQGRLRQTGAIIRSSWAIASANPPVRHMPTAPTPGPPPSSWAIAARWRSHATIGLVVPVAQVANSRATQTLARDAAV
jgi:hypothetical protein